jgi:hypothetical protein
MTAKLWGEHAGYGGSVKKGGFEKIASFFLAISKTGRSFANGVTKCNMTRKWE